MPHKEVLENPFCFRVGYIKLGKQLFNKRRHHDGQQASTSFVSSVASACRHLHRTLHDRLHMDRVHQFRRELSEDQAIGKTAIPTSTASSIARPKRGDNSRTQLPSSSLARVRIRGSAATQSRGSSGCRWSRSRRHLAGPQPIGRVKPLINSMPSSMLANSRPGAATPVRRPWLLESIRELSATIQRLTMENFNLSEVRRWKFTVGSSRTTPQRAEFQLEIACRERRRQNHPTASRSDPMANCA